jgi:4-amino-4-deoxy-L-arabinose transferase-like glycosyltransferase
VGAALRLIHCNDVVNRTPDEQVYVLYAKQLADNGLTHLPSVIAQYNQNSRLWIYPPPTRAGYLVLLAIAMKIMRSTGADAGVALAWFCSVASLVLISIVGARFLPPWAAIYATFGLALSFCDLVTARRCWQEDLLCAFSLVMLWATCEIAREHRGRRFYAILIGAGSLSVCAKELVAVVYGACAIYLLVLLIQRRAWPQTAWLVCGGFGGALLSFGFLAMAAGGTSSLFTAWQHMREAVNGNPYAWGYQNLPWPQFFQGFWILAPVNLILAALATALAAVPKRFWPVLSLTCHPEEVSRLRLFAASFVLLLLVLLVVPTLENFRYLSPAYGPFYLLGGFGLWAILSAAGRKLDPGVYKTVAAIALAVVFLCSVSDYNRFEQTYVAKEIQDLSVKMVLVYVK